MRNPRTAGKSGPRLLQLEKARAQERNPMQPKTINKQKHFKKEKKILLIVKIISALRSFSRKKDRKREEEKKLLFIQVYLRLV